MSLLGISKQCESGGESVDIKDTLAGAILYTTLLLAIPVAAVVACVWSGYEWIRTKN